MANMIRRRAFHQLIEAANNQTDAWLADFLRDATLQGRRSMVLSRLACLRILVWRKSGTGLTYIERKRTVRFELGI